MYRDRATTSNKTQYLLTCYLLAIELVPRHSYNSTNLVPGQQKMRHASLIAASETLYPDSGTLPSGLHALGNTNALYCLAVRFHYLQKIEPRDNSKPKKAEK
jgi:hypothetical protein